MSLVHSAAHAVCVPAQHHHCQREHQGWHQCRLLWQPQRPQRALAASAASSCDPYLHTYTDSCSGLAFITCWARHTCRYTCGLTAGRAWRSLCILHTLLSLHSLTAFCQQYLSICLNTDAWVMLTEGTEGMREANRFAGAMTEEMTPRGRGKHTIFQWRGLICRSECAIVAGLHYCF